MTVKFGSALFVARLCESVAVCICLIVCVWYLNKATAGDELSRPKGVQNVSKRCPKLFLAFNES